LRTVLCRLIGFKPNLGEKAKIVGSVNRWSWWNRHIRFWEPIRSIS